MTLISTPLSAIQVGIAIQTKPNGIPEENDRRLTEAVRQVCIATKTGRQEEELRDIEKKAKVKR